MEKGTTHPSSNMPKSRVISNFRKTVHDQRTGSATTRAIFCPGMCRYGHINVKNPTAGSASKKAPAMHQALEPSCCLSLAPTAAPHHCPANKPELTDAKLRPR